MSKKISTSALAKKLSTSKYQLDEILLAAGYITKTESGFILTELGIKNSGELTRHKRFGEYIAWDEDIVIPKEIMEHKDDFYSSTKIAQKYNLSARKINMALSEIGFIQKYLKGWTITELGIRNGGIQKENNKNGVPYVEWDETIFTNNAFSSILQEIRGEAGDKTQEKIDSSENANFVGSQIQQQMQVQVHTQNDNDAIHNSNFRERFVAKQRATDGHMVRSKAEMLIDNWLYMAEIVHAYERKLPIEEEVYCDFYIPTGKIYIEFWGLENEPKYAVRKEIKKAIYEKYNFKLIELTDKDVFNLDDILPRMLLKHGVQTY